MYTSDPSHLDRRGIFWFVLIAFGLAWLLILPLWIDPRGLTSPWAFLIPLMNFTPTIATLVVICVISRDQAIRRTTGLWLGAPGTGRVWVLLFGWLGMALFVVAAPFVGALFGRFPLDLQNYSSLRGWMEATEEGRSILRSISPGVYAWSVLLTLPLQGLFLIPFTFGEEWGWRGYLLPRLLPLGQLPALLISGVLWGLWHAPVVLLGMNYPGHHPFISMVVMVAFTTVIGVVLGWTRLATGSVWPSVLGHASANATQVLGGVLVLLRAGETLDQTQATLLGWTGWLLPLLFIALLVLTRRLPVRNAPDLTQPENDRRTVVRAGSQSLSASALDKRNAS